MLRLYCWGNTYCITEPTSLATSCSSSSSPKHTGFGTSDFSLVLWRTNLSARCWWKRDWLLQARSRVEHDWGAGDPWGRCFGCSVRTESCSLLLVDACGSCNFGWSTQCMEMSLFSRSKNAMCCDSVASILEKVAFPALSQSSSAMQPHSVSLFQSS